MSGGTALFAIFGFVAGMVGGLAWAYPRLPEDFHLRRWIDRIRGRKQASAPLEPSTSAPPSVDRPMLAGGVVSLCGSILGVVGVATSDIGYTIAAVPVLLAGMAIVTVRRRALRDRG